jgi:hypothetical protein
MNEKKDIREEASICFDCIADRFDSDTEARGFEEKIDAISERLNWEFSERLEYTKKLIIRHASIYKKVPRSEYLVKVLCDSYSDDNGLFGRCDFVDKSLMNCVSAVNVKAGLILVKDNKIVECSDPRREYFFEEGLLDRELFDSLTEPTDIYQFVDMCRERWGRRKEAIAELEEREEFKDFERRLKDCKAKRLKELKKKSKSPVKNQ